MKLTRSYFAFASAVALAAVAATSQAAPINLVKSYPDAYVDQGRAVYTAATHTLTLSGTAEYVNLSSSASVPITGGTFTATVVLTPTGGSGSTETFSVASGSLTLSGDSGSILASLDPVAFGYSVPTDNFQVVFDLPTGADALGSQIELSYHGNGGIANYSTSYFDADFSSSSMVKIGTADVSSVPEPASLALLGLAAPLFLRRRRKA